MRRQQRNKRRTVSDLRTTMKCNSCLLLINNNLRFQYEEYEDVVLTATELNKIRFQDDEGDNEIYFLSSSIFIINK